MDILKFYLLVPSQAHHLLTVLILSEHQFCLLASLPSLSCLSPMIHLFSHTPLITKFSHLFIPSLSLACYCQPRATQASTGGPH